MHTHVLTTFYHMYRLYYYITATGDVVKVVDIQ